MAAATTDSIGIIGVAHTAFGRLEDDTVPTLVGRVTIEAIKDAGIEPTDVDEVSAVAPPCNPHWPWPAWRSSSCPSPRSTTASPSRN